MSSNTSVELAQQPDKYAQYDINARREAVAREFLEIYDRYLGKEPVQTFEDEPFLTFEDDDAWELFAQLIVELSNATADRPTDMVAVSRMLRTLLKECADGPLREPLLAYLNQRA
jgi:hypothetical protein